MRAKLYNNWQSAQSMLAKKRETEVKLQVGGKLEKLAQIKQEIEDVSGVESTSLCLCILSIA